MDEVGDALIEELKSYPAYKDSGVPWLGKVPGHWRIVRTRYLLKEVDERSTTGAELRLSMSQELGLVPSSMVDKQTLVPESCVNGKLCREGDIVLNRLKAHLGVFALARQGGIISPDYTVLRLVRPMVASYFEYVLRSPACRQELRARAKGIVEGFWRLYTDDLYDIRLPTPPVPEQSSIVHFLAHANRRIQLFIRAKKKLITLLNEQKQAIIHRAVTRGPDPNVRLKNSGVEWLGEVPENWSLRRFKCVVKVSGGQVDPREPEHRSKILIAPNHIKSGAGRISSRETAEGQGADSGKYQVRRGQVIYSKIRPSLRKAAIATEDCLCSADMYPLTAREDEIRPEFLLLLLLSEPFTRYAVDCSLRVAMPKVNRESLAECLLWYPELPQQDEILQFVHRATAPFNRAIEHAEGQINLLHEYRSQLITDVVTGKLDVREAAARLPEETEEPEPLDEGETVEGESAGLDALPEEAIA